MKSIDIVFAAVAVLIVVFTVWFNVRRKRRGESCGCSGCGAGASKSGGCSGCSGSCDTDHSKN